MTEFEITMSKVKSDYEYLTRSMFKEYAQVSSKHQKEQRLFAKCFASKRIPRKLKKKLRKNGRWASFCLAKVLVYDVLKDKTIMDLLISESFSKMNIEQETHADV